MLSKTESRSCGTLVTMIESLFLILSTMGIEGIERRSLEQRMVIIRPPDLLESKHLGGLGFCVCLLLFYSQRMACVNVGTHLDNGNKKIYFKILLYNTSF